MRIMLVTLTLIATTILGAATANPQSSQPTSSLQGVPYSHLTQNNPTPRPLRYAGNVSFTLVMKSALCHSSAPILEKLRLVMDYSYRDLWIHIPTSLMGPSPILGSILVSPTPVKNCR